MIPERCVHNILASWPVGVLSTWGRNVIHSVPVVFVAIDDEIISPVDGKPKSGKELQRVVDLERDSRFTLLLQHYSENWEELWWLRLNGHGKVETLRDEQHREKVTSALRRKYSQYSSVDVLDDSVRVLRLKVEHTSAWAWAGLDWLTGQFS
ncbi:MAG: pyridoxamine 5'-phosphate oxidase family protein [Pseudomonadales bacterium]|nr:pyridoxamine 5'-phosphate oxidase family protein [Pseudomonadales bacterium]